MAFATKFEESAARAFADDRGALSPSARAVREEDVFEDAAEMAEDRGHDDVTTIDFKDQDGGVVRHLTVGTGPAPLVVPLELLTALEAHPGYFPNLRDPTRALQSCTIATRDEHGKPSATTHQLLRPGAIYRGSQCYDDHHVRQLRIRTILTLYKPAKRPPASEMRHSTQHIGTSGGLVGPGASTAATGGNCGNAHSEEEDAQSTGTTTRGFASLMTIPIAQVLPQELQPQLDAPDLVAASSGDGAATAAAGDSHLQRQIHVNLIPTGTSLHILRKFPWWNVMYVLLFGWWAVQGGAEQAVFTSFPSERMKFCASLSAIVVGVGIGVLVGLLINLLAGGLSSGAGAAISVVVFIVVVVGCALLTWWALEKYWVKKWEGWETLYITILDHSKAQMAEALRVFADADNYPVLVHCIHGKDRTGLVVFVALNLALTDNEATEGPNAPSRGAGLRSALSWLGRFCQLKRSRPADDKVGEWNPDNYDVPIGKHFMMCLADDYAITEMLMLRAKARGELGRISVNGAKEYMIGDLCLGSPRKALVETAKHLVKTYGSVRNYAARIGLTREEVQAIRRNLRRQPDLPFSHGDHARTFVLDAPLSAEDAAGVGTH